MTTMADAARSFANQLQPLGRQQAGTRALALFGLAAVACEVDLGTSWRQVRNAAAHARSGGTIANDLFDLAFAVDAAVPTLDRAFSEALIPDVSHAGAALPTLVLAAAQAWEVADNLSPADAGEFFDAALIEINRGKATGEIATSPPLARLMVELLELRPHLSLYDPACGLATALVEAIGREPTLRVLGDELDGYVAALARLRLHLRGARAKIRVRDALADISATSDETFDRIVCDPPVSVRLDRQARQRLAQRYGLAQPPSSSEAAFLLQCAESLAAGGRAVVLAPIALLSRDSDQELRRRLLKRGDLEGIITLPTGVVPWTELAFALLILHRSASDRPVRLADAEDLSVRTARGAERLTAEQVAELVQRYRQPGVSDRVVDVRPADLIANGNLRPRAWLHSEPETRPDLDALHDEALKAEAELRSLASRLDALAREPTR